MLFLIEEDPSYQTLFTGSKNVVATGFLIPGFSQEFNSNDEPDQLHLIATNSKKSSPKCFLVTTDVQTKQFCEKIGTITFLNKKEVDNSNVTNSLHSGCY